MWEGKYVYFIENAFLFLGVWELAFVWLGFRILENLRSLKTIWCPKRRSPQYVRP